MDVPKNNLMGRIVPQNALLEEYAKRGLGNVGWEVQKMFDEYIKEESIKLRKTKVSAGDSIPRHVETSPGIDRLNPDCEDPPIKLGEADSDWEVKKHWKELLGRDPRMILSIVMYRMMNFCQF